jgi:hypothetical protein
MTAGTGDAMPDKLSAARSATYSIGVVIKTALLVVWRNLGAILLISLVFESLLTWIDPPSEDFTIGLDFHLDLSSPGSVWRTASHLLGYAFVTAPITYLTLRDLTSDKPGLGDIIKGGFRRIVRVAFGALGFAIAILAPVLVVGLVIKLLGLPLGLASIFALMSGLFVAAALFVLVPSLVVENVGYFGSFGRSTALTKGRRWSILAILLIGLAFTVLFGIVAMLLIAALAFAITPSLMSPANLIPLILPLTLFNAAYCVVWAVIPAVTFYYLRQDKEGSTPEQTAVVFD